MEEYKLLIVDDELLVREHMANILDWNRLGISQILEAANGYEAIELVKQHAPQIMILDIKMPEMNGMQLLEHIKVLDVEIQIIVSSGYSDFEAARRMLSMGQVVDYLLKPVGADMMFEAVCKCIANLEEKQQREELFKDLEGARNTLRKTRIRDLLFGLSREEDSAEPIEPQVDHSVVGVGYFPHGNEEPLRQLKAGSPISKAVRYYFSTPKLEYIVLFFEGRREQVFEDAYQCYFCGSISAACFDGDRVPIPHPNGYETNI